MQLFRKIHISWLDIAFVFVVLAIITIFLVHNKSALSMQFGQHPPFTADSTGTMLAADPERSGVYQSPALDHTPSVLWTFTTDFDKQDNEGDSISSVPVVANGNVYFGTIGGAVYAVDTASGKRLWKHQGDWTNNYSSPAVADSMVYIGSDGDGLSVLDANNGDLVWKFRRSVTHTPDDTTATDEFAVNGSPVILHGIVYFGSNNGVYALDAYNGQMIWHADAGGSTPAIHNGIVYDNDSINTLFAINSKTGKILWKQEVNDSLLTSYPVVSGNTVYISSDGGTVYAFDAITGTKKWVYTPPANGVADNNPTVDNNTLYSFYKTSEFSYDMLVALDATTGTVKWQTAVGQDLWHPPIINNHTVYLTTLNHESGGPAGQHNENYLYAVNSTTGQLKWKFLIPPSNGYGNSPENAPSLYNGILYIGTTNGTLYALH